MSVTKDFLKVRQSLPLEQKIVLSKTRIRQWYDYWGGKVYVAFSGGKDSTVLLHLVRSIYPNVPAVFVDTGLEYPEIREFVNDTENVETIRPCMSFNMVIKKHGFPVISKKLAKQIRTLRRPDGDCEKTKNLILSGITSNGYRAPSFKIAEKWKYLIDAPFLISDKCCDIMKKKPSAMYSKDTGRMAIVGTMAADSRMRESAYLKKGGCNGFDMGTPTSTPLSFWVEPDIWEYIKKYNVKYSKIYDMGEKRTGCMFCMFGVHLEKGENRFQRMAKTHPRQYDYCINKLGCGDVMDYIGIEYRPSAQEELQL